VKCYNKCEYCSVSHYLTIVRCRLETCFSVSIGKLSSRMPVCGICRPLNYATVIGCVLPMAPAVVLDSKICSASRSKSFGTSIQLPTVIVPSDNLATVGRWAFPVSAANLWNSLPCTSYICTLAHSFSAAS